MPLRSGTISYSPWARAQMDMDREPELGRRALALGVHVSCLVRHTANGPVVVTVWNKDRTLRFSGRRLADLIAFGLDRWAAGADDTGVRWVAGPDHLAHGHRGPLAETLCGLPWRDGDLRFAHEERARCADCWVALDRKWVAA